MLGGETLCPECGKFLPIIRGPGKYLQSLSAKKKMLCWNIKKLFFDWKVYGGHH